MSVTITKTGADAYFDPRNHIKGSIWEEFNDNLRTAAIEQAKRIMSRALGCDIEGESVDTADYYQPDYAVYEQALYSLVNSEVVPNGEGTGPKFINSAAEGQSRRPDMPLIADEAKTWLNWGSGKGIITVSRG